MKELLTESGIQQVIAHFSEELKKANSAEEVAWNIVDNVIAQLNYEDCVIYLYNSNSGHLVQTAAFGPKNTENRTIKNPIVIEPGEGIVGRVFEYGEGEIVNDTSKDSNYIIDDRFRLSEIAVPIMFGGDVIGIIDSEHTSENFFTPQDMEILTTIAEMASEQIQQLNQN